MKTKYERFKPDMYAKSIYTINYTKLKKKNINIVMITGDNRKSAEKIGEKLGITNIIAEVLPQDKEKEVSNLQRQNKKVAFVRRWDK